MAVVQISKIQLRRGFAADLPGQPTNPIDPASLQPGLDVGELGFASDTAQLFIGGDAVNGYQGNRERLTFPYQNIEVLTEFSPLIQRMIAFMQTGTETVAAMLDANVGEAVEIEPAIILGGSAALEYTLTSTVDPAITRRGRLQIALNIADPDAPAADVVDSYVAGAPVLRVAFYATVLPTNHIRLDYTNREDSRVQLTYRFA